MSDETSPIAERQQVAMAELMSELGGDAPGGETLSTESPEHDGESLDSEANAAEETPAQKRAKRLEQIKARDAERHAEKQRIRELERALAHERSTREQYELRQQDLVDLKEVGALGIIGLAERAGLTPEDVVKQLREATLTPETVEAKKVAEAFKKELKRVEDKLAQIEAAREEEARQAHYMHAYQTELEHRDQFTELVTSNADKAPYSARFMEHVGKEQFLEVAAEVARALPEGCGLAKVLQVTEKELAKFAAVYGGAKQRVPAPKQVTNRSASSRGSLMTEDDLAKLSYEERRELFMRELNGKS